MHPADAAFLRAIREQPDDDLPRLIYADYLDERGDPRGEFIRLRCQLAGWVPELEPRSDLQRREQELLSRYLSAWLGPLDATCCMLSRVPTP